MGETKIHPGLFTLSLHVGSNPAAGVRREGRSTCICLTLGDECVLARETVFLLT